MRACPGKNQIPAEPDKEKDPPGQTGNQVPSEQDKSQRVVQSEDEETQPRTGQEAGDKSEDRPHCHTEGQNLNDSDKSAEAEPTVVPAVTAVDTVRNNGVVLGENENVLRLTARNSKQKNKKSHPQAKKVAVGEEVEEERVEQEEEDEETEMEEEEDDCTTVSQPLTDSQVTVGSVQEELYQGQQIRKFLQKTKNHKNVKFEDH